MNFQIAPKHLAQALRSLRLRAKKGQEDVAHALGLTKQSISKWENEKAQIAEHHIEAYLKAIGYSGHDLNLEIEHLNLNLANHDSKPHPWWNEFSENLHSFAITNEEMAPWAEPGEKIFYEKSRQPKRMEGCVLELKSGETLVRLYEKSSSDRIFVKKLNPESSEFYLWSDVTGLHRVALRGD